MFWILDIPETRCWMDLSFCDPKPIFLCNLRLWPLELAKQKCVCFGLCADHAGAGAESWNKNEDKWEEGALCGLHVKTVIPKLAN